VFRSVLVANRGEIAVRVFRTARRLGVRSIAVFSDADRGALHTREADEAVYIGPAPAAESYLNAVRILKAARDSGAEAIHPGYGFLSENFGFSQAVKDAGLIWIGPSPHAIKAMGLKDEAKRLAEAAGVPVLPGYRGADQSVETLQAEADRIGYPLLIKAIAGGGGRGIREVHSRDDVRPQLESARREALAAFGNDLVMLERLVTRPRHIEVQVFGDSHGNIVHLYERDCSLQRRRQKVVEEAPAPGMNTATRKAMTEAAVKLAMAVDYQGAGTVEFIVDGSQALSPTSFWFLEMNTRLQVEHPVTELITGVDLVEWQFRVAAGEPLPLPQNRIPLAGHAIEARIAAENPALGFRPSVGRLRELNDFPVNEEDLRLDAGYDVGDRVPGIYDNLVAKLIAHGVGDKAQSAREAARVSLVQGLCRLSPEGFTTNVGFLVRALETEAFVCGAVQTGLIAEMGEALTHPPQATIEVVAVAAGLLQLDTIGEVTADAWVDPWATPSGFRVNAPPRRQTLVTVENATFTVELLELGSLAALLRLNGQTYAAQRPSFTDDGARTLVVVAKGAWTKPPRASDEIWSCSPKVVSLKPSEQTARVDGQTYDLGDHSFEAALAAAEGGDDVRSPMPGKLIALAINVGDAVTRGQTLAVVEAMKMEMGLPAPRDGVVEWVHGPIGTQLSEGQPLVRLAPLKSD